MDFRKLLVEPSVAKSASGGACRSRFEQIFNLESYIGDIQKCIPQNRILIVWRGHLKIACWNNDASRELLFQQALPPSSTLVDRRPAALSAESNQDLSTVQ